MLVRSLQTSKWQVNIYFCRFCERYLNPPNQWVACALESRELMALCLKRIKNLSKVVVSLFFHLENNHSIRVMFSLVFVKKRSDWWTPSSSGRSRTRSGSRCSSRCRRRSRRAPSYSRDEKLILELSLIRSQADAEAKCVPGKYSSRLPG